MDHESAAEFERIYAQVGDDLDLVPWAALAPHPRLVAWLASSAPRSGRALVIGCGLGDDAEAVGGHGLDVTAFDASTTAIGWCHRRFPESAVAYRVDDLFDLPREWLHRFDVVIEINTVQSIPPGRQVAAIEVIAGTVAAGGQLFSRCLAREPHEPAPSRPWALSRVELASYEASGLREIQFVEAPGLSGRRTFEQVFVRPAAGA